MENTLKSEFLYFPGICFPSRQDIQEKIEYEAVAYPYTIQQMMESAARQRKEEREKIEKRDRDIAAKFAKLEQWKKELNDKLAKKTAEVSAAKVRYCVCMKQNNDECWFMLLAEDILYHFIIKTNSDIQEDSSYIAWEKFRLRSCLTA